MSPKPKTELARQHLETARAHVEDNAEGDAVNALFYAAEAAVDGLSQAHGIETKQRHRLKASAATALHERGALEEDLAPLLRQLNQARKDIWYEGAAIATDWERRLRDDRERSERNQSPAQREITATLLRRARTDGAEAFALTGSTARAKRTTISDLDYHVVGARPRYDDLPDDVDVYVTDVDRFWSKLREGDDMVQWTLRFGCILHDSGIFREGLVAIERDGIWPDPARQLRRLQKIAVLAARLIEMEDEDAALDQVRAGLTLRARAFLLVARVFPLARSELPGQLEEIGGRDLAAALNRTIDAKPGLDELRGFLGLLEPDKLARPVKRASNERSRTSRS